MVLRVEGVLCCRAAVLLVVILQPYCRIRFKPIHFWLREGEQIHNKCGQSAMGAERSFPGSINSTFNAPNSSWISKWRICGDTHLWTDVCSEWCSEFSIQRRTDHELAASEERGLAFHINFQIVYTARTLSDCCGVLRGYTYRTHAETYSKQWVERTVMRAQCTCSLSVQPSANRSPIRDRE